MFGEDIVEDANQNEVPVRRKQPASKKKKQPSKAKAKTAALATARTTNRSSITSNSRLPSVGHSDGADDSQQLLRKRALSKIISEADASTIEEEDTVQRVAGTETHDPAAPRKRQRSATLAASSTDSPIGSHAGSPAPVRGLGRRSCARAAVARITAAESDSALFDTDDTSRDDDDYADTSIFTGIDVAGSSGALDNLNPDDSPNMPRRPVAPALRCSRSVSPSVTLRKSVIKAERTTVSSTPLLDSPPASSKLPTSSASRPRSTPASTTTAATKPAGSSASSSRPAKSSLSSTAALPTGESPAAPPDSRSTSASGSPAVSPSVAPMAKLSRKAAALAAKQGAARQVDLQHKVFFDQLDDFELAEE